MSDIKLKDQIEGLNDTVARILERMEDLEDRVRDLEVSQPVSGGYSIEEYEDIERNF